MDCIIHFYLDNDTHVNHEVDNNTDWNYDYYLTFTSLIFSIAFLGVCFTLYGLYCMIKTDHYVPVYVINLFICDLIQTSALLIEASIILILMSPSSYLIEEYYLNKFENAIEMIYFISVVVNICFMVCISADRYTMTAYPIWYNNISTIRKVYVSVTIWIIFGVLTIITDFFLLEHLFLFMLLILILPYPLVIIFFVGTWRALSRNSTISPKELRWIMGTLALVLSIYTVLFLPFVITIAHPCGKRSISWSYFTDIAHTVMTLNPLFDFLLYLVMRKDAKDFLSAPFFCFRKRNVENSSTHGI